MFRKEIVVPIFLFCISILSLHAQQEITLNDSGSLLNVGKQVELYEDRTGNLSLNDIIDEHGQAFKQSTEEIPNIGNTKSAVWCRFKVNNRSSSDWFLRIGNPYLDTVQVFIQYGSSFLKKESGKNYSFNKREIKSTNFIFPLSLQKDSPQTIYIRVKHHITFIPIELGKLEPFLESESKSNTLYGFYFGIISVFILVNFLFFLSFRDINLVYYILWILVLGIYAAVQKGFMIQFLPESLIWMNKDASISLYFGFIFLILFSNDFLRAKEYSKPFYRINIAFLVLGSISIVFFFTPFRFIASTLLEVNAFFGSFLLLVFSFRIYKKGFKPARFYFIAFSVSCISYTIYGLQAGTFIPVSSVSSNALFIGSLWETIFLTYAIVDRINILRSEKYKAEKEKAILVKEQNILLEQKVEERTHQLETEKKKSDDLLLNILPQEIADEIKKQGKSAAKTYSMVTVMFTDFKDFTEVSEKVSAELLVAEIDYCFSAFDEIIQKYKLEKIKTVGDAYLCAGGMPLLTFTHAEDTVRAAIEIRNFMQRRKQEKEARGEIAFEIRIGIHTGSVVAGVVGKNKFAYDIWGDTVNLAARLEENSEAGRINISGITYNLVKGKFNCTHRGKIEAKNKGEVDMYFVD